MIDFDLDNLRSFISKLSDFYEQLNTTTKSIQNATRDASGFWRDEVFLRCSQELELQTSELLKIVSVAQGYEDYLERLHAAGLEYLSCR